MSSIQAESSKTDDNQLVLVPNELLILLEEVMQTQTGQSETTGEELSEEMFYLIQRLQLSSSERNRSGHSSEPTSEVSEK